MADVEFGGQRYRTGRLNAFQQFHLFRKLLPILSGMGETFNEMPSGGGDGIPEGFWSALGPAATAIAEMSQEDSEYILKTCLGVVSIWNGTGYVRVTTPAGDLMFENIDMKTMLQLAFEVMKENLSSFFADPLPSNSEPGDQVLEFPMSR